MNEKRFISLVNLYIDHEISPEELEELENEVAHNDQRRRVYHEYRRLQVASQTACQEFGSSLAETVDLKKYHILARCSQNPTRTGLVYSFGAMAAACLSVLAAVSVFNDPRIGGEVSVEESSSTVVEVFQPGAVGIRVARGSARTAPIPEVSTVAASPRSRELISYRNSRGNEFLTTLPSTNRPGFHFPTFSGNLMSEESVRTGSSGRVFRSGSSFEAPDLASVQFQR